MTRVLPISARFFLLTFAPVSVALIAGFVWFGSRVEADVREGVGRTLAESQQARDRLRLQSERRQQMLVAAVAENPALKAGLALWLAAADRRAARATVEDQLLEVGTTLDADLISILDASGAPIAGQIRRSGKLEPLPRATSPRQVRRLIEAEGAVYESMAAPVNLNDENLGVLLVGKRFDAAEFHTQAVLLRAGKVAATAGLANDAAARIAAGIARCDPGHCAIRDGGATFLAVPAGAPDGEFQVWTLHSVDAATSLLLGSARQAMWAGLIVLLVAAAGAGGLGARAVSQPLVAFVQRLRESARTGVLHGDFPEDGTTSEVNQLAHAFNLAARSVSDSQRRLDEAYLQFTQTMAQTLDARDAYTAGHSSRVSACAAAVAEAMNLSAREVEVVRVGANLHDIGKIGIPDAVLQKPGSLTDEEFRVIQEHPLIGKRILEGVARFRDYLEIVELHHENHDGSGYPWGLSGTDVPLTARIVHVVDAYDAMTTSRPYRPAMPRDKALSILIRNAGRQFDPAVVEVFLQLVQNTPGLILDSTGEQLLSLGQHLADSAQGQERGVEDAVH